MENTDLEIMLLNSNYEKCEACKCFYKNLKQHFRSKKHIKKLNSDETNVQLPKKNPIVKIYFDNLTIEI
jgi:hypothetical protein